MSKLLADLGSLFLNHPWITWLLLRPHAYRPATWTDNTKKDAGSVSVEMSFFVSPPMPSTRPGPEQECSEGRQITNLDPGMDSYWKVLGDLGPQPPPIGPLPSGLTGQEVPTHLNSTPNILMVPSSPVGFCSISLHHWGHTMKQNPTLPNLLTLSPWYLINPIWHIWTRIFLHCSSSSTRMSTPQG